MAKVLKVSRSEGMRRLAYVRALYAESDARGQCRRCPEPVKAGISHLGQPYRQCEACLEIGRERAYGTSHMGNRMAGVVLPKRDPLDDL